MPAPPSKDFDFCRRCLCGDTAAASAATAPSPQVQVINFAVCPGSDTHDSGVVGSDGQPVPACNRDWSASAFAPGSKTFCTGEVLYGTGREIELTLLREGVLLVDTEPRRINGYDWYFYLYHVRNPSIPSGNYACQVKLEGEVVAERPFSIAQ